MTEADCTPSGQRIDLSRWPTLASQELAQVVGVQCPSGDLEYADGYTWSFRYLPLAKLIHPGSEGDVPEGGWNEAYRRQIKSDQIAVNEGSPAYAGRDAWIKNTWTRSTDRYPLFVSEDEPGVFRLWDGHHRLAGAFYYQLDGV